MNRIIFVGFLILLLFALVWADSPPTIELKPGSNEVSINVLNNSDLDFESICVVVKQEDLPEGFFILESTQKTNVSAKSKNSLLLTIEIKDNVNAGVYQIPFMLKDKNNHSWSYSLTAKLKTIKPEKYDLYQNYPNPFNVHTKINYSLTNDNEQETGLVILNLLGKQIQTLVNEKQAAGRYSVIWNGKDEQGNEAATGIYFYKLTSGSFIKIRKMSLLK